MKGVNISIKVDGHIPEGTAADFQMVVAIELVVDGAKRSGLSKDELVSRIGEAVEAAWS